MKKIFRSVAALAVVLFAGCTTDITDDVVAPSTGGTTTITVGFDETKTSLGELVDGVRKVYWSAGDKIAVNGITSAEAVISEENKGVASFTFEGTLTAPYSALYPAEAYVDDQTINLAANQGRGLENVAANALPMAGYSTSDEPTVLHHLAGAVKLQIKVAEAAGADTHPIRRVELSGNNGEQMAGNFTIDYASATLTPAGTEKSVRVEINKDNTDEGVLTVFAVVPAQEYANGFTARIIDKAGHFMDIKSSPMTIAKGEIKAMPAVEFVPTGTVIDAEISIASAADWNTFVKAYNEGTYSNVLVDVKFTQDIVFDDTTNAEFETLAGTAAEYEFEGIIDGGNFAIKGLKAGCALIHATSGAHIKNLTIDESCEFTFANIVIEEETYFGALVNDIFTSTIENVTFNANVTYDAITAEGKAVAVYFGNFAGRTNKQTKMINCVNNGAITANDTCNFGLNNGAIPSSTVYIGGLVGYSRCHMESCTNNGDITSSYNAKTKSIAGVAGRITGDGYMVGCANTGTITDSSRRKPAAPININDYNRTVYIAGVVGLPACNMTNCSNSGSVVCNTNVKSAYAGGVVAYGNSTVATLDGLTNTGAVTSQNEARYPFVGGIIGENRTPNISNFNNEGAVTVSKAESSTTVYAHIGGVIGTLSASIDGKNTITNSGAVTYSDGSADRSYIAIGGVVGATNANDITLAGVSNSGTVTNSSKALQKSVFAAGVIGAVRNNNVIVDGVSNSGYVAFTDKTAQIHVNVAIAGVVGCVGQYVGVTETLVTATIKNSVNTGKVARASISKCNGSGFICGGVVGILKGAGSSVSNCTNKGQISVGGTNNSYYDTNLDPILAKGSFAIGGIVGVGIGVVDTPISISNCSNEGIHSASRGYCGGVAGYLRNAAVSACGNTANISGANTSVRVGGLTGYINASTVTSCSVVATVDSQSDGFAGGITGGMNATASVVSSTFDGIVEFSTYDAAATNADYAGAITGTSEAGSAITNCGAKGQIGIESLSPITVNDFDGMGNATVTGAYILE